MCRLLAPLPSYRVGTHDDVASVLGTFFTVISTIIVIVAVTPWFIVGVIPLAILYAFTQRYFVQTAREIKRLDSVTKSPLLAHFSETLQGTVTIRAYGEQHRFMATNAQRLDTNQTSYFASTSANRWLAVRLEFIGAGIVTGAALSAVLGHGTVSASLAGLSVSYALSVTQSLNWMVRMTSQVESQIVAVERVREYADLAPEDNRGAPVPDGWPFTGKVDIQNLCLSYRQGLPPVLRDVSLNIAAGEKVGVRQGCAGCSCRC